MEPKFRHGMPIKFKAGYDDWYTETFRLKGMWEPVDGMFGQVMESYEYQGDIHYAIAVVGRIGIAPVPERFIEAAEPAEWQAYVRDLPVREAVTDTDENNWIDGQHGYVDPIKPDGLIAKKPIQAGEMLYIGDNAEFQKNLFKVVDVHGQLIENPRQLLPRPQFKEGDIVRFKVGLDDWYKAYAQLQHLPYSLEGNLGMVAKSSYLSGEWYYAIALRGTLHNMSGIAPVPERFLEVANIED